jgi:hypothetical protein
LSSYVPPSQAPAAQWPQPGADPRGYDLGQYTTTPSGPSVLGQPALQYPVATHDPAHGYAPSAAGYPQGYEAHDHGGYAHNPRYHGQVPALAGHDPHPQAAPDEGFDEEPFEDEPRRVKRTLMVVAALVGAIGIGGGLAYGYKKFGGGGANTAATKPAVVAEGARKPLNTDRKIIERLPEPQPAAAASQVAAATQDDLGGPRKVQVIPIGPGGSGPAATAPPGAPPPAARPTINVPGVTLDAGPAPIARPPAAPPQAAPPAAAPKSPVQAAPSTAAPPPKPVATINAPTAPAAPTEPARKTPAPPVAKATKAIKANDAFQPGTGTTTVTAATGAAAQAATAPPAAARGANGFVAVLSSQGSRLDALKVYADLQQRYGEVLANKPADVQETVVNGKTWFRAVVGPPGSRQAANEICTQIKAAGHKDCFATAY